MTVTAQGRSVLLVAALLGGAGEANAERVRVLVTGAIDERPVFARVRILAQPIVSSGTDRLPAQVEGTAARGELTFELAPGMWVIRALATGLWGASEDLRIEQAGGVEHAVTLKLWPTSTIRALLRPAEVGAELPQDLRITFRSPDGPEARAAVLREGGTICPVRDDAIACDIPAAGLLDLELRARGYVPHYRSSVRSSPKESVELGILQLRRGGSLSGFVKTAEGGPAAGAEVELRAPGGEPIQRPGERSTRSAFYAVTSDRGFFQIYGMPAAHYRVTASKQPLAADDALVHVLDGIEAKLAMPLVLTPPANLEVVLDPPTDPAGARWTLDLRKESAATAVSRGTDVVTGALASKDGRWTRGGLSAGTYSLTVRGGIADARWVHRTLSLPRNEPLDVEVPLLPIKGRILLGDEPLRASIVFDGRAGSVRVPVDSDEEGEFSGVLPQSRDESREWEVYVHSPERSVSRNLENVQVSRSSVTGAAELEIRLPTTILRGIVVDERGAPFTQSAIVTAQHVKDEELVQVVIRESDAGQFRMEGLPPGDYRVSAAARSWRSEQAPSSLRDAADSSFVRIELKKEALLRGQVLTRDGSPVPGARIKIAPIGPVLVPSSVLSSDVEGRFEARLAAGARELGLGVAAPGFAYVIARFRLQAEGAVVVPVDRSGGRLVLELPKREQRGSLPVLPFLFHGGHFEAVPYLADWARLNGGGENDSGQFVIPNVAPGAYALCMATGVDVPALRDSGGQDKRCSKGTLLDGGELVLRGEHGPSRAR